MNADSRRQLENQLLVMGLKKLEDPALVEQLGRLVLNHDMLRGLLNECEQEKRSEMYEAIRPHLRFQPKPLETYISELAQRAADIESWKEPVQIGEKQYQHCERPEATGAVASLTCKTCHRTARFHGATPVCAIISARQAGWVRDRAAEKEVCPKCPCEDRGIKRKCPSCGRKHYAPDCRMITEMEAREVKRPEPSRIILPN